MYRSVRLGLAALLTLAGLIPGLAPPGAFAQVQNGATLTVLRGQVAVVHSDGSAVQPAPSGTIVKASDEIRTLTKTGALITFFAGTEIEMGEDTILVVERVSVNGSKVDISLKQALGTTLNRVQSLTDPTSTYRIDAGGATAVVRGTTFLLIGPVATASGNVSALICMDDCDGRTTFAGCPVAPYTGFGVTVANDRPTSGCETVGVGRGEDYFNAGFEAVTAFEQTFASAHSDINPGTGNLGREEGQRRADERRQREDRDDRPQTAAQTVSSCQVAGGPSGPGGSPGPGGPPLPGGSPTIFGGFGSVLEGNAGTVTLNVTIFLFPASSAPVSVAYATANLTATAGSDYVATSGTLTFPPGSTTQNVAITVNGDVAPEDDEFLTVNLSSPTGAVLASGTALGTIVDDDSPPRISIGSSVVHEGCDGTSTMTFGVHLSQPQATAVTVSFATANGSATAGSDYQATSGTVTFAPGQTFHTIDVTVIGDATLEPDEAFTVNLSGPSPGVTLTTPSATGTIINDD
jgi:hypothetical protein